MKVELIGSPHLIFLITIFVWTMHKILTVLISFIEWTFMDFVTSYNLLEQVFVFEITSISRNERTSIVWISFILLLAISEC